MDKVVIDGGTSAPWNYVCLALEISFRRFHVHCPIMISKIHLSLTILRENVTWHDHLWNFGYASIERFAIEVNLARNDNDVAAESLMRTSASFLQNSGNIHCIHPREIDEPYSYTVYPKF